MAANDVVTVELPRHMAGSVRNALKREAVVMRAQSNDTDSPPSERAIAGAEASYLSAAAQAFTKAMRK